MTASYYKSQI